MSKAIQKFGIFAALVLIVSVLATLAPGQSGKKSPADKSGEQKYAKYISYDVDKEKWLPKDSTPPAEPRKKFDSTIKITPLLDLDRVPGAFYIDLNWMGKGYSKDYLDEGEHYNDFDEVIGLIGSQGEKDPRALGGEVEMWLGGEKYLINRSCLIFVPKGLKHCPIRFKRIDAPILFFSIGMTGSYTSTPSYDFVTGH